MGVKRHKKVAKSAKDDKSSTEGTVFTSLHEKIRSILVEKCGITALTPVQQRCVRSFLRTFTDVVVQAPTGSGKTLAYVLPIVEMILKQAQLVASKHNVIVVVLVPNRELAIQVQRVFEPFATELGFSAISFVPSKDNPLRNDQQKFVEQGGNVIVATPGRLSELISAKSDSEQSVREGLRHVEVLIVDECDRLLDESFTTRISHILSALPKQRRTGLFSATYVHEGEELNKFVLRNPQRIRAGGDECTPSAHDVIGDETQIVGFDGNNQPQMPTYLNTHYVIVRAEEKVAALIAFLKSHAGEKILVFMKSAHMTDYLKMCAKYIWQRGQHRVISLHGKMKKKRAAILDRFRAAPSRTRPPKKEDAETTKRKTDPYANTVLFATDVMARGIDVADIDWVVQFDVPRQSAWFIHRAGRSARCGREGNAIVFLMPSEESYVQYLSKHENIDCKELKIEVPPDSVKSARRKIIKQALKDRAVLEKGTRAYVSYVQSYAKHDCRLVCALNDLDVVGVAHSFGLIRLPKMPELSKRDLSAFERHKEVNTADIAYKDKKREERRLQMLEERRRKTHLEKKEKARQAREGKKMKTGGKRKVEEGGTSQDDFASDFKLMKRLKKGRISKEEFNAQFGAGAELT